MPQQPFTIGLVAEGQGDQRALPALLTRWLQFRGYDQTFSVELPVVPGGKGWLTPVYNRNRRLGVEYYVDQVLNADPTPAAVLVVLDADAEQPDQLGLRLRTRLHQQFQTGHPDVSFDVLVANHAYENWFLLVLNKLQRLPHPNDPLRPFQLDHNRLLPSIEDVESVADPKRLLTTLLPDGYEYKETRDQPAFTNALTFEPELLALSCSYRKLFTKLERIIAITHQHEATTLAPCHPAL